MTLTVTILMDGDAFKGQDWRPETARILHHVAAQVADLLQSPRGPDGQSSRLIFDTNGTYAGQWKTTP